LNPDFKICFDTENLTKYINHLFNKIEEELIKKKESDLLIDSFLSIAKMIYDRRIKLRFCGAGKNFLAVSTTGKLYPCHRFVGIDEFCVGDVKDGIEKRKILEKFIENQLLYSKKCLNCWCRYFCGGGCYYMNWVENKDIYVPNHYACEYHKSILYQLLRLFDYIKETSEFKKYLTYRENFLKQGWDSIYNEKDKFKNIKEQKGGELWKTLSYLIYRMKE